MRTLDNVGIKNHNHLLSSKEVAVDPMNPQNATTKQADYITRTVAQERGCPPLIVSTYEHWSALFRIAKKQDIRQPGIRGMAELLFAAGLFVWFVKHS